MRYLVVICCVLASVAAKDRKISLEDIERDNIKTEKTGKITLQKPPTGSPASYGFLPVKTAADYARQQPKSQYISPQFLSQQQYTPPSTQQYQTTPEQYYYQPQRVAQPSLHQQYENIQYIADNNIGQQYYTPQFLYLQQYTAPSTAVQSVVNPKGGIQYIMYVPTYVPKAEQTQNYENIVYTGDQQTYTIPATQYITTQQQVVTPSIKYAPEVEAQPHSQPEPQPQPQPQSQPHIQPQRQFQPQKFQTYSVSSQPKSLLDSYVPSILQVQYYKQQQARANAIQQSVKETSRPVTGKIEYAKINYRPTQTQHSNAESTVNYNNQIPDSYSKYNN